MLSALILTTILSSWTAALCQLRDCIFGAHSQIIVLKVFLMVNLDANFHAADLKHSITVLLFWIWFISRLDSLQEYYTTVNANSLWRNLKTILSERFCEYFFPSNPHRRHHMSLIQSRTGWTTWTYGIVKIKHNLEGRMLTAMVEW